MAEEVCPQCGGELSSFGDNLVGYAVYLGPEQFLGLPPGQVYDGRQLCLSCERTVWCLYYLCNQIRHARHKRRF